MSNPIQTQGIARVKSKKMKVSAKEKYEKTLDSLLLLIAISTLLMGLFHFFEDFLPFLTIALGITLILSIPIVGGGPKYYSLGMLILGSFFLFKEGANFPVWQEAISSNMNLLLMFVLVPILSLPVRYGNYIENINLIFRNLKGVKWKIHAFTSFLMALLTPILTLGAVTMIKDLAPNLSKEKTFIVSLSRLFGLTLFWTPYFGTVVFILQILKIEWVKLVPFTLSFALIGILLSILMEKMRNGSRTMDESMEITAADRISRKKIAELVIIFFMILAITLGIYYSSNFGMAISISLVSLFIPLLWLFYLKKLNKLMECTRYYLYELLPKLKGEVLLMLSAGFFGFAFVNSSYSSYVPKFFSIITGNHPLAFIFCLSFIMIAVATIGLHPFIMTTIFAATLSQGGIPISLTMLAFVIFCSWGMAIVLSPYSACTLVVSRDTPFSTYKVSVIWNFSFIGILFILLVATAYFLHTLGF